MICPECECKCIREGFHSWFCPSCKGFFDDDVEEKARQFDDSM